jgi:phosphonoacetate hydrolase
VSAESLQRRSIAFTLLLNSIYFTQLIQNARRILTREEAAREYKLMASRIGDLIVWGDRDTVFGEMDMEQENFSSGLRSHRSLHELNIPLFVYHTKNAPPRDYFQHNVDLARWVYQI